MEAVVVHEAFEQDPQTLAPQEHIVGPLTATRPRGRERSRPPRLRRAPAAEESRRACVGARGGAQGARRRSDPSGPRSTSVRPSRPRPPVCSSVTMSAPAGGAPGADRAGAPESGQSACCVPTGGPSRVHGLLEAEIRRFAAGKIGIGEPSHPWRLRPRQPQQERQYRLSRHQVRERPLEPVTGAGKRFDAKTQRPQMVHMLVHGGARQALRLRASSLPGDGREARARALPARERASQPARPSTARWARPASQDAPGHGRVRSLAQDPPCLWQSTRPGAPAEDDVMRRDRGALPRKPFRSPRHLLFCSILDFWSMTLRWENHGSSQRKKRGRTRFGIRRLQLGIVVAVGSIVAIVVLAIVIDAAMYYNKVHPGVSISSHRTWAVLTRDAASAELTALVKEAQSNKIVLTSGDKTSGRLSYYDWAPTWTSRALCPPLWPSPREQLLRRSGAGNSSFYFEPRRRTPRRGRSIHQ